MIDDVLQKSIDYGLIDLTCLADQVNDMNRKEILESHSQKIWQGTNGYWFTYIKSPGGERSLVKRKTREELNEAIIERYEQTSGRYQTLEKLFDLWISKKLEYGEIKKQSAMRYRNNFIEFYGDVKDMPVSMVTSVWLEDYMKRKLHELYPPQRTWCNVKTITNGMFKYARKHNLNKIDITDFFNMLDVSRTVVKKYAKDDSEEVFTEEELDKILALCEEDGSLTALGVMLDVYTGLRSGELVALKFSDVKGSFLNVSRTEIRYTGADGKVTYDIQEFTKGRDGSRKVVLVPDATHVIKLIRGQAESLQMFPNIHGSAFTNKLYRICDKLNIPRRSLHKLRKTYATRLIDANIPRSVITNQMGHTEIGTTEKYYYFNNHNLDEAKELIYNAI